MSDQIEVHFESDHSKGAKGTIVWDYGRLDFESSIGASVFASTLGLSLVSITTFKSSKETYSSLYVGFGRGHCMTWIIFDDPQPLIDFFERICVEMECEWYVGIHEKDLNDPAGDTD